MWSVLMRTPPTASRSSPDRASSGSAGCIPTTSLLEPSISRITKSPWLLTSSLAAPGAQEHHQPISRRAAAQPANEVSPCAILHRWAWCRQLHWRTCPICRSAWEGCRPSGTKRTSPVLFLCPRRKSHLQGQRCATERMTWCCRKPGNNHEGRRVIAWHIKGSLNSHLLMSVMLTVVWISGLHFSLSWPRNMVASPDTCFKCWMQDLNHSKGSF